MFRIGEFSKIAQVPGSLLRYYDQIGLLKPAHIDPFTGYRYYSAKQLPRLHRILALKELGLTLEQVTRLVNNEVTAAEIWGMLTLKKAQVEQTVHEELVRLRSLEARLQMIDVATQPEYDIVIKQLPAQDYLSLREVLPGPAAALAIMKELLQALPSQLERETLGQFMTVVHSETLESDQLDIELGATYLGAHPPVVKLPGSRYLQVRQLPAITTMATVVRMGGFEQSCGCYGAIGLWVENNGYRITGPGREVLIHPPRNERLDEMVTEIQFPVERDQPVVTG